MGATLSRPGALVVGRIGTPLSAQLSARRPHLHTCTKLVRPPMTIRSVGMVGRAWCMNETLDFSQKTKCSFCIILHYNHTLCVSKYIIHRGYQKCMKVHVSAFFQTCTIYVRFSTQKLAVFVSSGVNSSSTHGIPYLSPHKEDVFRVDLHNSGLTIQSYKRIRASYKVHVSACILTYRRTGALPGRVS